jgi:hypothetical protein
MHLSWVECVGLSVEFQNFCDPIGRWMIERPWQSWFMSLSFKDCWTCVRLYWIPNNGKLFDAWKFEWIVAKGLVCYWMRWRSMQRDGYVSVMDFTVRMQQESTYIWTSGYPSLRISVWTTIVVRKLGMLSVSKPMLVGSGFWPQMWVQF